MIEGTRKYSGDITELQNGCIRTLASASSAIIDDDNAVVTVSVVNMVGGSAIVTIRYLRSVAVATTVAAGGTGTGGAGCSVLSVRSRTRCAST
jgi:hypothetical protein